MKSEFFNSCYITLNKNASVSTKVCLQWNEAVIEDQELTSKTEIVIPDLKTGLRYQFRVTAVNRAGKSQPSSSSKDVEVKDKIGVLGSAEIRRMILVLNAGIFTSEPPVITLEIGAQNVIEAKAGTTCKIVANIKARPPPEVG